MRKPVKKVTVYISRSRYVVLRLQADSPGLWYFHCHIIWHERVGMGMGMALQVGGDSRLISHDIWQ